MAGLFSEATLEQVRAASDIVDVIGGCIPLKRAGANFVALCPFHKEKTPSFNVNPQRQIFHCFGCHKGGDVFRFLQDYENISFVEAVRRLAERARIPLEMEQDNSARQRRSLKETLLQIHEGITQRWQAVLANDAAGQRARDYLQQRGVAADALALFRLGAAPEAWDDTVNWARSKGHDLALVEQAGLILRKPGTDRYYDRFRSRLIFPICDEQGRVVAFSGRILAGDEKTAKYVNSPETPIFTKGRILYGLDKSKRALLDARCAVICEGQLDLIACFMAGVQHVVAPQGTALTAEHARVLRRYVEEVVLCFDADLAGQNAAVRALGDLLASGLAIRVATIPSPHDPDSYIKNYGATAFRNLIERARNFFDFYLELLSAREDLRTDRGRVTVVRAMGEALARTGNAVLIDTYAQRTAQQLGVAAEAVRSEFRRSTPRTPPPPASESAADATHPLPPPRPSPQEYWLLKLVLLDDELVEWTRRHLDLEWVQDPAVRRILAARFAATGAGDISRLVAQLDSPDDQGLTTEVVTEPRPVPNRPQQTADLLRRLRDQHLDRQLADAAKRLARADVPETIREELLRQQQQLRQLKRQPPPWGTSKPGDPPPSNPQIPSPT